MPAVPFSSAASSAAARRPVPMTHALPGRGLREMPVDECAHLGLLHAGANHRNAIGQHPPRAIAGGRAQVSQRRARTESGLSFRDRAEDCGMTCGHLARNASRI